MAGRVLSVLQEPRGYLKLIELVTSILALVLTCSFKDKLLVYNKEEPDQRYSAFVQFPFFSPVANVTSFSYGDLIPLDKSIHAGAIAFVAVNGTSLLVVTVLLTIYFIVKRSNKRIVIWDVFINCLMGFAVIIVAIAWNVQLLHLKTQVEGHVDTVLYLPKTDPDQYCTHDDQDPCATNFPSYRLLVIALVFGYSAGIAWLINVWFVYRNTYLHHYELMVDTGRGAEEIAGSEKVVASDTGVFQMTVELSDMRGPRQHSPAPV